MAIGTGAALLGSALAGSLASTSAARKQASAANTAARTTLEADALARRDLQPFASTGGQILNPLLDFVRQGPESDLERAEGFEAIQNSAAAGGKLRSGGTLKALTQFNNVLNARNRAQRFNELFNLATLGQNAAARQGTNTIQSNALANDFRTQGANARAAGIVGLANQGTNALRDFVFLNAIKPQPQQV